MERNSSGRNSIASAQLWILLACTLCGIATYGNETPPPPPAAPERLPGHSDHGEAFNEGPRQKAYLMDGMPNISFPVTTRNDLAQKFFNQGVGQLHGFWYFEAERSFRQVAAIDPDCAMAYWGMAMANIKNAKRATEFMKQATEHKNTASPREKLWIASLSDFYQSKKDDKERRRELVRALENISYTYPDDLEAKAFLVFQVWDNSDNGIPLASGQALDALADEVLARNPMHPVHHYRIHLWDGENKPDRAINSAGLCGQTSTGIAHMWHMPGHTFSKLHRYADAAWQQEASARVDHAQMIRDRLMPDQIHNYAHNNDWDAQDLSYIGRVRDAISLAKNMVELPRLAHLKAPQGDAPKRYDSAGSSYQLGRNRLFELTKRFELWDELISLCNSAYLEPSDVPEEQIKRLSSLGVAWFSKGEKAKGIEQREAIEKLAKDFRAARDVAADGAESKARQDKKPADEIAKARDAASKEFKDRIERAEKAVAELRAYEALADKNTDTLKAQLDIAKEIPKERLSQIYLHAGDKEKAATLAREAFDKDNHQVALIANYADVLYSSGKTKEALDIFQKLQKESSWIDLNLPVMQRLAPLAAELKLPTDWRAPRIWAADSGDRPDLSKLGPFRWHPSPAPKWSLAGASGQHMSLKDFRGKPVLVVFYLGNKCLHCVQQLESLSQHNKEFEDAGISIVAISSESVTNLTPGKDSKSYPFPLLSDTEMQIFKAYRAYDDFENMPLHGTFLIDGAGLVRWQNISFEPFMETQFLLDEAKRLLQFPVDTSEK